MTLELSQLYRLRDLTDGNTPVAPVPRAVADYLGCKLTMAYLSSKSLRHVLAGHPDLDLLELLHMPDMIQRGLWLSDHEKPHMATVIYEPLDAPRYMSALKVVGDGFEPYMCSFYRLRDRDLPRKLKRGNVLRPHLG
jgi:hypothetical protein